MYEERETFEPANLSILAMRSPERVRDVFVFILPLYYQSRILATSSLPVGWRRSLPEVDQSAASGPVTSWFSRCFRLQRRVSPAVPGEESGRLLSGSLVRSQLQIRGS